MKKTTLVLLGTVPFLFSFVADFFLSVPGIRVPFLFLMPLALLIYWLVLGTLFARFKWKYGQALLGAHAIGLVSLLLYVLMQLFKLNDVPFLARLVQRFTLPIAPLAGYIYEGLGFPGSPDFFNADAIWMGLLTMILVFSLAFALRKKKGTQRTARQF